MNKLPDYFEVTPEGKVTSGNHLFKVLMRRRMWLVMTLMSAMAGAMVITWQEKPLYQSKMQMLIEPNDLNTGNNNLPNTPQEYATQVTLMRSREFLEQTITKLKTQYPTLSIEDLERNFHLNQIINNNVNTSMIEGIYQGDNPQQTQEILSTIQEIYQDYNKQQQQAIIDQGLAFVKRELPLAKQKLSQAQTALEKFQQTYQMIDPNVQAQSMTKVLNETQQQRQQIEVQYQNAKVRYETIKKQLNYSPQEALIASRLSESNTYQSLMNKLQETELELADKKVTFTDDSPIIKSLLEKRQNQLNLLSQEFNKIVGLNLQPSAVTETPINQAPSLSKTELELTNQLINSYTELLTLEVSDRTLTTTQQQLQTKLNTFPRILAEYNRLKPEIELQQQAVKKLLETQQQLSQELTQEGFTWQIIEVPERGKKISPSPQKNLLIGGVLGLFLGIIVALLREALDDMIHTSEDLDQVISYPLLGKIPYLSLLKPKAKSLTLAPFSQSESAFDLQIFRDTFDLIYKNIQLSNSHQKLNSLIITSAIDGEGKSSIIISLALSAARLHQKVLLIDANFRRPSLHQRFALNNQQGLSNLLLTKNSKPQFHSVSVLDNSIDVLTAGVITSDPVKLLSSQRMQELMNEWQQQYDLIFVDTCSLLGKADVLQMASLCSGLVLVSRIDQIKRSDLSNMMQILEQIKVIGVISNGEKIALKELHIFEQIELDQSVKESYHNMVVQDKAQLINHQTKSLLNDVHEKIIIPEPEIEIEIEIEDEPKFLFHNSMPKVIETMEYSTQLRINDDEQVSINDTQQHPVILISPNLAITDNTTENKQNLANIVFIEVKKTDVQFNQNISVKEPSFNQITFIDGIKKDASKLPNQLAKKEKFNVIHWEERK